MKLLFLLLLGCLLLGGLTAVNISMNGLSLPAKGAR